MVTRATFNSLATGHHVFKETWSPVLGEVVFCERESNNQHDRYAVALLRNGEVVGHIPRNLSKPCFYALLTGGTIYAVVTGERQNIRHNGLEVPMEYHVKGPREHIQRMEIYITALNQ